jgi:post-segregation antitoxin (ccd killing protein)
VNPETDSVQEKASEHVSVELPANLVNKAREAGVDVEAVCRTAISTAAGFKSNPAYALSSALRKGYIG